MSAERERVKSLLRQYRVAVAGEAGERVARATEEYADHIIHPTCGRCGHDPRECEPSGARTVSRASTTSEPERIYLQPACCADPAVGRVWCDTDAPVDCDEGVPWTEYVRADLTDRSPGPEAP